MRIDTPDYRPINVCNADLSQTSPRAVSENILIQIRCHIRSPRDLIG